MTITEFLLARIAEDETEARSVISEYEEAPPSVYEMAQVPMLDAGAPGRVLAECEAKRRIVTLAWAYSDGPEHPRTLTLADDVLRHLAQTYADHPDYDPAWRVAD